MRIGVYTNAVAGGWNPTDPDTWGGSEEAVVRFAAALGRRAEVDALEVYGSFAHAQERDGVAYRPHADVATPDPATQYDLAIYWKAPGEAATIPLAPVKILWTADALPFIVEPFARVVTLSDFHERALIGWTPQAQPRVIRIPLGYCPEEVASHTGTARDPHTVLYCSSPDRGLLPLLQVWPQVRNQVSDARLTVAYGWELFLRCGGSRDLPHVVGEMLARMAPEDRDSITIGRLSHDDIHRAFARHGVWAYWCTGGEMFCQVAVKAQLAGCYPVVRPFGAMHETVWRGTRLDARSHSLTEFGDAIAAACDPEVQARDRAIPPPDGLAVTWDDVAALWMHNVISPALAGTPPPETPGRPAPLLTHLRELPPAPPLLPDPHAALPQHLGPAVLDCFQAWQPQMPWVSPSFPCLIHRDGQVCTDSVDPAAADCAVLAWDCEETEMPLHEYIAALPFRDGCRLVFLASIGAWRAQPRFRHLSRRCLAEVFGRMPEFTVRVVGLDHRHNGVMIASCRLDRARIGRRDVARVVATTIPRDRLSVCMITLNEASIIGRALDSVRDIADEIVIVDTGSTDNTCEVVERWAGLHRIPLVLEREGYNPRYCFDCHTVHEVGVIQPGHHVAGFETPRNQSVALASGEYVLWLDADEEVQYPENVAKYLRPCVFGGYAIAQHHFATEPPDSFKIDIPVRIFRRDPDGSRVGLHPDANGWPTFYTGCRQRFTGIVHEHPGQEPDCINGIAPVIKLADVHIAHDGYFTEIGRRRRFVRNWPLMAADCAKHPERRLTQFLMMRDIQHQLLALMAMQAPGHPYVIDYATQLAEWWERQFCDHADPFTQDALTFVSPAHKVLNQGQEYDICIKVKKPEVSGEHTIHIQYVGRFACWSQMLRTIDARGKEVTDRWEGSYL